MKISQIRFTCFQEILVHERVNRNQEINENELSSY